MGVAKPTAFAGLLLLAAVAVHAAEGGGGALDETKKEIRQLQSDQQNKPGQGGDKLKLRTQGLDLQIQDSGAPEAWLSEKLKKDRKLKEEKDGKKNWLVDGVDKLEREQAEAKGTTASTAKDGAATESTAQAIDQSDPEYLLKLFDAQKKSSDSKATAAKSSPTAAPDPFAPFLQGWLGSSPARGQFFDQFVKKPETGGSGPSAIAPTEYRPQPASGGTAAGLPEALVAEKGNPYLVEMNAPILAREVTSEVAQLSSPGTPSLAPEASKGGPVLLPADPAPAARERAKAPLPGLADDKKYFPQLKRF